ncbi:hypothetical protein [Bacillus phage SPO1L5]|nr:hypothetical protein [Bacillus phage SPO1L5]
MNAQEWLDEIPEDLTETVLDLPPKTIKKLIGLNNSQLRAVLTLEGPVQINAVAGSGKTRVLTSRIAYMLSTGIKARHILCTTYTKKATQEMTERLSKLISSLQLAQITIGTTHSIGYRILAEELEGVGHPLSDAFKYNNVIMGTRHKIFAEKIVESMERDRHVPFSIKQEMRDIGLGQYIGAVSWAKNEGISWDQYDSMHGGSSDRQDAYIEFYKRYEKKKVEECVIDGDDMLYLLWWLFKQYPDVLARYQKKFKYLLVDEAQDNNGLQYEIIKMLGKPENNLFLVGDDDQCQPAGEQVLTTEGYVNIEDLDPEKHKVVSYDKSASNVVGLQKGYDFKIARRPYTGELFKVTAKNKSTLCTPNHKWIVKWDKEKAQNLNAVYLMQKGEDFRVGWCKLFKTSGESNVTIRARNQKADKAWVLSVFESEEEASLMESIVSANYGIVTIPFIEPSNTKYYKQNKLNWAFSKLINQKEKAVNCLKEHGRRYEFPFYSSGEMFKRRGGNTINEFHACNLIAECMKIPVHLGGKKVSWEPISLDTDMYEGYVYSLDVDVHELYIVEGLVTHNSMYSFRGAKPEEFIDFTKTYKGAQQISMEDNYRSNPHILEVANNLIKNNQKRLPKKLVANKQNDEPCVSFEVHESEIEEAKKVVEEIKLQVEQGGKNPKDITILYRTNAQSRALEDYLIISGIPYVIHGGTSFYERKEIKDLICYLRLVADSNDDEAFKRVINTPSRYLGKAFMEKVKRFDGSHWEAITEPSMSWKNYEQKGINEFVDLVEELKSVAEHGAGDFGEGSPTEVIDYLLDNCYKKHMSNELTSDDFSSRMENVETLKFVMEQHDSIESFLKHISDLMSQAKHDIDGVQLMTIHKSKGLEFDTAFVVGVSEGCLPHFRAIESYNDGRKQAIEEERRLLYVAITRAESVCHISAPKTFLGKPAPVSRFSKELGIEISDMSGTDVDLEDADADTSDLTENLLKWGGN